MSWGLASADLGGGAMKLKCPSCRAKVDIGSSSRYHVFGCGCGRRFRGINADIAGLDWLVGHYLTFSGKYDNYSETPCPYCSAGIPLEPSSEFMGVDAPDVCWACGRDLPTDPVSGSTG
jgi:hypothetical protein